MPRKSAMVRMGSTMVPMLVISTLEMSPSPTWSTQFEAGEHRLDRHNLRPDRPQFREQHLRIEPAGDTRHLRRPGVPPPFGVDPLDRFAHAVVVPEDRDVVLGAD